MENYHQTISTWNKLATAYQDKFMGLDLYNDTYAAFCQLVVKPNARLLEIGCGPGNITRYLLAFRPDFNIQAIDAAPNMVALAQQNNPTATFKTMDARDIAQIPDKFDGILCGFCLPYLSKEDCAKLIGDCSSLLTTNGVLYLSTIEGDYQSSGFETSSNGQDRMFVYYHQEDYLRLYLEEGALEVVHVIRKPYPKAVGTSSTHLILIARKSTNTQE